MTTALALLASTYLLVLFLGLQSLNVNGGHRLGAFVTSFAIGGANLALYKLAPNAAGLEIAAYLLGGPAGIVTAMAMHPRLVALYRKPSARRN
jgi:hypothetical protein